MYGVPPVVTTFTTSENSTVITKLSPEAYVPSLFVEVTFETVGAKASITRALEPARELLLPKVGKVKVASLSLLSLIVPPFSSKAEVETYSKSEELSPD